MNKLNICILGGTGFIGRSLSLRLVEAGHRVNIITRQRERHRDLLVLPTLQLISADPHNSAVLRQEFRKQDVVINLVGILNERGRSGHGFERVHVELPRKVVDACRAANVPRLLHMSSLNADVQGGVSAAGGGTPGAASAPSHYLRTKALGEQIVHAAGEDIAVTSFRPAAVFGARDRFTNRFAHLLRVTPFIFPLACPDARLQPVYVEDVVRAFIAALSNQKTHGQAYNLCGPQVYRLREVVAYIAGVIGVRRRIIGLGGRLSRLQAVFSEFLPGKPFSLDNYRSLQRDGVCADGFPALFNVRPVALEEIAPAYLGAS